MIGAIKRSRIESPGGRQFLFGTFFFSSASMGRRKSKTTKPLTTALDTGGLMDTIDPYGGRFLFKAVDNGGGDTGAGFNEGSCGGGTTFSVACM